ncbi:hypothetical protein CYLTODRAFT_447280 [Cylindrobasidium torrendii FP15055 ss-10]|uniref:Uncharacterized protein n=1 Tax=Cylindrobasidium torrendii FP15055 ss-10 TaxID=1314674 RepID=A0A0D7AYF5_9AGAR|nr:hypothetical protein CYLTODRAFT_447280 [Cylindrobasidium torrendii FP15055 ss-10]
MDSVQNTCSHAPLDALLRDNYKEYPEEHQGVHWKIGSLFSMYNSSWKDNCTLAFKHPGDLPDFGTPERRIAAVAHAVAGQMVLFFADYISAPIHLYCMNLAGPFHVVPSNSPFDRFLRNVGRLSMLDGSDASPVPFVKASQGIAWHAIIMSQMLWDSTYHARMAPAEGILSQNMATAIVNMLLNNQDSLVQDHLIYQDPNMDGHVSFLYELYSQVQVVVTEELHKSGELD